MTGTAFRRTPRRRPDSAAASTSTSRASARRRGAPARARSKASIETSKRRPRSRRRTLRSISSPPSREPDRLLDPVLRHDVNTASSSSSSLVPARKSWASQEPQHLLARAGDPVGRRGVGEEPVVARRGRRRISAPHEIASTPSSSKYAAQRAIAGAVELRVRRGRAGSTRPRSRAARARRSGAGSRRSRCPRPTRWTGERPVALAADAAS